MNAQARMQCEQFLGNRRRKKSSGTDVRLCKLNFWLLRLHWFLSFMYSVDIFYFFFNAHHECSRTLGADSQFMFRWNFLIPSTKIVFVWLASLVFKEVVKSFISIQRSHLLKKWKNAVYQSYYNWRAVLPYLFLPAPLFKVFDWRCLILNKPIKDAFAFIILSLWTSKIVLYVIFF